MIIDIYEEYDRVRSILDKYLIGSEYFVYDIDVEESAIYLDKVSVGGGNTAYLPFYLEDYEIFIFSG